MSKIADYSIIIIQYSSDDDVIKLIFCRSGDRGRCLFGEVFMYYRRVRFYRCAWKTVPIGGLYFRIHTGARNRPQVGNSINNIYIFFQLKSFFMRTWPHYYYFYNELCSWRGKNATFHVSFKNLLQK